jgi:hypothetical protein
MRWIVLLVGLMLASSAFADVDIQYKLPVDSDGRVTGVRDTPPSIESVAGHGIVTLTGVSMADIVWPVPSGCAGGMGQASWSRVTNPATVASNGTGLAVRSGLLFFSTTSTLMPGCFEIRSKAQLTALVNQAITQALSADHPLGESLTRIETRNLRVCPHDAGNCKSAHNRLNVIRNVQAGEDAAFDALLTQVQTLKTNYDAFVGGNFP